MQELVDYIGRLARPRGCCLEGDGDGDAQLLARFVAANDQEAFATAKGVYDVVYEKRGYWFRTPEAWGTDGMYRASMYMRPGAIWSMEMMAGREGSGGASSANTQR